MELAFVLLLLFLQMEVLVGQGSQLMLEFVEFLVEFVQLDLMCSSVILKLSFKDSNLLTQPLVLNRRFTKPFANFISLFDQVF